MRIRTIMGKILSAASCARLRNKAVSLLAGVAVFAAMAAATGVTYSWLTSLFYGEENISVTTGTTPPIEMAMWLYTDPDEGANPGWVEQPIRYDGTDGGEIVIPAAVTVSENTTSVTYYPQNFHLGTIDNLVRVKKDNIVYCRFKINAQTQGTNLTMNIRLPQDSSYIHVYDKDGVPISNSRNEIERLTELNGSRPFLVYQYAVSQEAMTPDSPGFDALFGGSEWTSAAANAYELQADLTDYSGDYYVYLKISPDLKSFGRATIVLYEYVPSILLFDWVWEITVH